LLLHNLTFYTKP